MNINYYLYLSPVCGCTLITSTAATDKSNNSWPRLFGVESNKHVSVLLTCRLCFQWMMMIISCENIRKRDCNALIFLGNHKIGAEAVGRYFQYDLWREHILFRQIWLMRIGNKHNVNALTFLRNEIFVPVNHEHDDWVVDFSNVFCLFIPFSCQLIHCLKMQTKQKLVIPLNYN